MTFWRRFYQSLSIVFFDVILGKLGLLAAQVHPSASIFWPVIGFDLALIFLFGYWVLPLIFVGSFLYNILTYGTVITCSIIAMGNTFKVFTAAKLYNKNTIRNHYLKFVVCCIPAAVIGGTIGVTTLLFSNGITLDIEGLNANILTHWTIGQNGGELLFVTWLNWTVGDFLGLILFTPTFQYLFNKWFKHDE